MKVLDCAAMQKADRQMVEKYAFPGAVLMESAGMRAVEFITAQLPQGAKVVVLSGPGNNGGDGLVIARLLSRAGYIVSLWSTEKAGAYRGDAAVNEKHLQKISYPLKRLTEPGDLDSFREEIKNADILVDALFGIGLDRNITGLYEKVIEAVNAGITPILSIDIPSGINADTGAVMGFAVKANWTITYAYPKKGLFLYPGAEHTGKVLVGDINIPDFLVEDEKVELLTHEVIRNSLPSRPTDSHKFSLGSTLIVAGSVGMSGAAVLAAQSALQAGSGIVYLAAPRSVCSAMETKLVEVISVPLPEKEDGIIDPQAIDIIIEKAKKSDAMAVGPGLDTGQSTSDLLYKLVQLSPIPLVFDAGALGAMGAKMNMLRSARHQPVVTPHPGEMAKLIGKTAQQVQSNRLETAIVNASLWDCIVVLKGPNTVIATPEGQAKINPTGSPALATAGSGDILTGMIASFIAQGMASDLAAAAAAYLHGLAGDLIPAGRGHMARDILDRFKDAFLYLEKCETGYKGNSFLKWVRPV